MSLRAKWMLAGLAVVGAAGLAVWAEDRRPQEKTAPAEHEVKTVATEAELLAELPARATATLMNVSNFSHIDSVDKVTQGEAQLFVAAWVQDGHARDASITEDGALVEMNEEVRAAEVPESVRKTGERFFSKGAKLEYQRKTLVMYVVRGPYRGHEHEIVMAPTGEMSDDGRGEEVAEAVAQRPATQPAAGVFGAAAPAESGARR